MRSFIFSEHFGQMRNWQKGGKKVQVGALGSGIINALDPLAPIPRFSHLIYTDLRGHQFWIKIGKNLPIACTKCSLYFCKYCHNVALINEDATQKISLKSDLHTKLHVYDFVFNKEINAWSTSSEMRVNNWFNNDRLDRCVLICVCIHEPGPSKQQV